MDCDVIIQVAPLGHDAIAVLNLSTYFTCLTFIIVDDNCREHMILFYLHNPPSPISNVGHRRAYQTFRIKPLPVAVLYHDTHFSI